MLKGMFFEGSLGPPRLAARMQITEVNGVRGDASRMVEAVGLSDCSAHMCTDRTASAQEPCSHCNCAPLIALMCFLEKLQGTVKEQQAARA